MDKRVRAIKHGQWQGRPLRPGDQTVMPATIADVYARLQQVEILGDAATNTPPVERPVAADRPGPPVETAAKPTPERRRKRPQG